MEEKTKVSKKILLPVLAILLIGSVLGAIYIVRSYSVSVQGGVKESFDVKYDVLDNPGANCLNVTDWDNGTLMTIPDLYPGESKLVCIQISNNGRANLHYLITSNYTGNVTACTNALGTPISSSGTLTKGTSITKNMTITIDEGATPFTTPCTIKVDVARGQ